MITETRTTEPRAGSGSPWGLIHDVDKISPGICQVYTGSHGGLWVSPENNAKIHSSARNEDGWYEEDLEWAIVAATFPEHFSGKDLEVAHRIISDWYPEYHEVLHGSPPDIEESMILRKRQFDAMHKNDLQVTAAWGSWYRNVPEGYVLGLAMKGGGAGGDREERFFLIPEEEYDKRGEFPYVVDPETCIPCDSTGTPVDLMRESGGNERNDPEVAPPAP